MNLNGTYQLTAPASKDREQKQSKLLVLKLFSVLTFLFSTLSFTSPADTASPPQMILRSVLVNTAEKRYDTALICSPGENNFQFIFEAIDLTFTGQITYRYRIHTYDKWKETQQHVLDFPSLPAGNYTFEAEAKTGASDWSDGLKFSFQILAPLYSRWWFILLSVICCMTIIAGLVIRRNKLYLKRAQEELIVQQRMNEMENQAKSAMMNPHFVFNALNSIQQYINDNDRLAANKYLTKFSRLIRLNLDLVNKSLITLEEELEKLKLYLEIEQLRFGQKLKYEFVINESLEIDILLIPSMILQPFIENAIWHGLMASGKGGTIMLKASAYNEDKMVRIEITDDGIGINMSKQINTQQNRRSFGTDLTTDRLQLFAKKYKGSAWK